MDLLNSTRKRSSGVSLTSVWHLELETAKYLLPNPSAIKNSYLSVFGPISKQILAQRMIRVFIVRKQDSFDRVSYSSFSWGQYFPVQVRPWPNAEDTRLPCGGAGVAGRRNLAVASAPRSYFQTKTSLIYVWITLLRRLAFGLSPDEQTQRTV